MFENLKMLEKGGNLGNARIQKEKRPSKGENQEFIKFRWTKYAPGRAQRI